MVFNFSAKRADLKSKFSMSAKKVKNLKNSNSGSQTMSAHNQKLTSDTAHH